MSPSQKYLGKSAKIPRKGLITWVENISYFIPEKCKIVLDIYKGMEHVETFKFKAKEISELLKTKVTDEQLSPIIQLSNSMELVEDFRGERKIKRSIQLEFAFNYSTSIEPWVDSFCNYINTTSGGVHLSSVQEAIWRFFMKKTNDSMSDREKEKYHVLKVDIESGLNLIVNIFTDMQMQLVGQTKNEVSSDQLIEPIKTMATECLEKYFNENADKLSQITKIIKTNCKARTDANKIKAATIKDNINKFDKHKIDKYVPCNNDGKAYKELHICEG
jgi:topoisomerase-4 subunit B